VSELESLGIRSEKLNELNDVYEVKNLVENIKQDLFQDFKSSYSRQRQSIVNNLTTGFANILRKLIDKTSL
ncbi:MAG: hypothetical protein WCE96_12310, partial [Nitrososphaeraceae archaeon]